jgi:hypothetical protein
MMAEAGAEGVGSSGSGAAGAEGSVPAPGGASDPGSGRTLLDEGGSGNLLDWRSGLPDNLRSAPIIQQHHTQESAAKTLVAQAEMIGRGIYLPKEEPGTEAHTAGMQKIYDKLGRPESADKYTWITPEGRTMDGEIQGRLAKAFYAHGLSQAQADGVMAEYWRTVSYAENIEQGREQDSFQQGRNALYAEFGANTEREMTLAQRFVEHFGAGAFSGEAGSKAWEQIRDARTADGARLINSPYLVATFAEAMRRLGEGDFIESSFYQPGQNTMQTMETRQKELTAKRHAPGGLSEPEQAELMRLNQQIVAARDRQERGRAA